MGKSMYEDEKWIGQKFGKLTVLKMVRVDRGKYGKLMWETKCDCGNTHIAAPTDIVRGKTKSCGCFHDERCKERATKFQHSVYDNKRLYSIYNGIKKRCFNKNEPRYKDYGARGITMCGEWRYNFDAFAEWALSHGYTDEMTIERVDVNGNYCPENCKWITLKEQCNNKRQTIWVDYKGEHIQLMKLCERKGISYDMVHNRIRDSGWDVERAIDTPSANEQYRLADKCREHNIPYKVVKDRMWKLGWDEERALTTPVKTKYSHKEK